MPNRSKIEKKALPAPPEPPQGPPAGLLRALEDTGRIRGSSATPKPTILSPKPSGGKSFQDHIDRMNRMSLNEFQDGERNTKPGKRSDLNVSETSDSSGGGATNSSQLHKPPTVRELAEECQNRLNTLIVKIQQAKLSTEAQRELIAEIKSIGTDFRDHQKRLGRDVDRISREREHFQTRLVETARHLQATTSERDRFRDEASSLRRSMENLRQQYTQKEVDMVTATVDFRAEIERLTKKVNAQGEQLKGKRTFWFEPNPGSSDRRSAMNALYDPFDSPSASTPGNFSPSFGSGSQLQRPSIGSPSNSMGSFLSPLATSPYNITVDSSSARAPPPKMNMPTIPELPHVARRRPGLPYLKPKPAPDIRSSLLKSSTSRIITEPGDTPLNPNYGAMVLFNKDPEYDPSPGFMRDFTKIFVAVEGWVKDHANVGNPAADESLTKNQILWEYMMNCTYPGKRNDAHAHTLALIKDRGCRYWFVMRMITSYLFTEMLSVNAWRKFSAKVDKTLEDVAEQLAKERGQPNEARQKLIERRAGAIRSIIEDPNYREWRSTKLHDHSRELRNMLGPMLNAGADRSLAGKDLGCLAIMVWDQSAKNNSAPYTFQTYFPDTNSKFSAGSMIARDRPGIDSTLLQIKQARVKLVITPVITLRDDGGTTIKARSLHFATVLLMG